MLPPGDHPEDLGSLSTSAADSIGAHDVTNEDIDEATEEQTRMAERVRDMGPLMRLALGFTHPVNPHQADIIARLDRELPEWRSVMNTLSTGGGIAFRYLVEGHYAEGRIDEVVSLLKEMPKLLEEQRAREADAAVFHNMRSRPPLGTVGVAGVGAGCFPGSHDPDDDVPIGEYTPPPFPSKLTPSFRLEATCSTCGQRRPRRSLLSRIREAITDWGLDLVQDGVAQLAEMGFHIGPQPAPLRTFPKSQFDDLYPGPGGDMFSPRRWIELDEEFPQEHNFERWQTGIFR